MKWLQDKKNLPIVIAIFAVVLIGVGIFLHAQMGGGSTDNAVAPTGPGGTGAGMNAPAATPTPGPRRRPGAMPAPGTMPGGAPGAIPAGQKKPGMPGKPEVATGPMPKEAWRSDPFLPIDYAPPKPYKPGVKIVRIPSVPPIFQYKRVTVPPEWINLRQQPTRRVAGIVFSQRVSALIETPDGWETVRPGDHLRDGTLVERIERDRVVLKTTDKSPRTITVKLAAAAIQSDNAGPAPSSGGGIPSYAGPGAYAPPRNDM